MIAENHENDGTTGRIGTPELPDPIKCFWLLLNTVSTVGKVNISQEHLDKLPDDLPLEIRYDRDLKMWHFEIPGKKRKRGIIKPSRRLILPGN